MITMLAFHVRDNISLHVQSNTNKTKNELIVPIFQKLPRTDPREKKRKERKENRRNEVGMSR